MPRDYYDILGVDRKAEPAQIKKAYRRLAKKHHPDVDQSEGAAKRFNEIQEAYDVLNDPEKRKRYDRFGHAGVHAEADPFASGAGTTYTTPGGFSFNAEGMGEGFSLDDVFAQFFGGGGPRAQAHPFQGRASAGPRSRTTARSRPADQHHTVRVPFETALSGGSVGLKLS
ncbi:MAG: DnaJ domain-containing protein, partial [Phycisphaeraceae bacterium]|nr:DnaJ domain-containing protein [Phycisphaeraceae bacterium]